MQRQGSRNSWDHTVKFLHDLDRARNVTDITSTVLRHLGQLGAEHVIATAMPTPYANRREQMANVLFLDMPGEWVSRYAEKGYGSHDPVLRRMRSLAPPFYWNELDAEVGDPLARRVMEEGSEFGVKDGFSASLLTFDRQTVGFSLTGRQLELHPEMRGVLTLVATYAIGRAIALQQEMQELPDRGRIIILSAREREALQWAADGKNDWEIGEIMNISEHGADKHLRSARAKLGATNRAQAVAEAIRRGLIA